MSLTTCSPLSNISASLCDCKATAAFLAEYITHEDPGYPTVLRFLHSLDLNWTDSEPTDWTLLVWFDDWYYDNRIISSVVGEAFWFLYFECDQEICPLLHLDGDPDLAGIGMMVSYYLVATLATLYVFVISLNSINHLSAYKLWERLHGLFEKTLNLFLDASLLFSISMLLASIYRFTSAFKNPDNAHNTFIYSLYNAFIISIFTVFPPLMIQFPERKLRRGGIRAILWFLVIAFVITLTVLFYIVFGSTTYVVGAGLDHHEDLVFGTTSHVLGAAFDHHDDQFLWLAFCDPNWDNGSLLEALDRAITISLVVLGLNLPRWIYLLFAIKPPTKKSSNAAQCRVNKGLCHTWSEMRQRYEKKARALTIALRALNITLCCATMWLLLSIFTAINVRNADAIGPDIEDRKLSVGQVLAVATFVPLIIDVVAIAMAGDEPEKALQGKLPRSYSVVENRAPNPAKEANAYV